VATVASSYSPHETDDSASYISLEILREEEAQDDSVPEEALDDSVSVLSARSGASRDTLEGLDDSGRSHDDEVRGVDGAISALRKAALRAEAQRAYSLACELHRQGKAADAVRKLMPAVDAARQSGDLGTEGQVTPRL
ncbi:hypothetical protein T484DRAFT_1822067, partial [Baffinella frigidus]